MPGKARRNRQAAVKGELPASTPSEDENWLIEIINRCLWDGQQIREPEYFWGKSSMERFAHLANLLRSFEGKPYLSKNDDGSRSLEPVLVGTIRPEEKDGGWAYLGIRYGLANRNIHFVESRWILRLSDSDLSINEQPYERELPVIGIRRDQCTELGRTYKEKQKTADNLLYFDKVLRLYERISALEFEETARAIKPRRAARREPDVIERALGELLSNHGWV